MVIKLYLIRFELIYKANLGDGWFAGLIITARCNNHHDVLLG